MSIFGYSKQKKYVELLLQNIELQQGIKGIEESKEEAINYLKILLKNHSSWRFDTESQYWALCRIASFCIDYNYYEEVYSITKAIEELSEKCFEKEDRRFAKGKFLIAVLFGSGDFSLIESSQNYKIPTRNQRSSAAQQEDEKNVARMATF